MDAATEKILDDFMATLIINQVQCMDIAISFRISKILLQYYQRIEDKEKTIQILERCSVFDLMMKEHLELPEPSPYPDMIERYLDEFDHFSVELQKKLVSGWLRIVMNRKELTFGLRKYKR